MRQPLRQFAYRLAYKLGWINVDEMLDAIPAGMLADWIAMARIGLDVDGWRQAGTIAATVHNEITSARYDWTTKDMPRDAMQDETSYMPIEKQAKPKRSKVNQGSIDSYMAMAKRKYK